VQQKVIIVDPDFSNLLILANLLEQKHKLSYYCSVLYANIYIDYHHNDKVRTKNALQRPD